MDLDHAQGVSPTTLVYQSKEVVLQVTLPSARIDGIDQLNAPTRAITTVKIMEWTEGHGALAGAISSCRPLLATVTAIAFIELELWESNHRPRLFHVKNQQVSSSLPASPIASFVPPAALPMATIAFSGALHPKKKAELQEIATALQISDIGTKEDLQARIKGHLEKNQSKLEDEPAFVGLFSRMKRKRQGSEKPPLTSG